MSVSILPDSYDDWKLRSDIDDALIRAGVSDPDVCPTCGMHFIWYERETYECAQCGRHSLCQECKRHCQHCSKTLCEDCEERITTHYRSLRTGERRSTVWRVCADCKVELLREEEEQEAA